MINKPPGNGRAVRSRRALTKRGRWPGHCNFVLAECSPASGGPSPGNRAPLGPRHERRDYRRGGIAHAKLAQQFANRHQSEKGVFRLVSGLSQATRGDTYTTARIGFPSASARKNGHSPKTTTRKPIRGSLYLKRGHGNVSTDSRGFKILPKTGRTHQIRVPSKVTFGCPVLCDRQYGLAGGQKSPGGEIRGEPGDEN